MITADSIAEDTTQAQQNNEAALAEVDPNLPE